MKRYTENILTTTADTAHAPHEPEESPTLDERITGALVGAAVGDALGGPVEGYSPEQITARHGGRVQGVVGPVNAANPAGAYAEALDIAGAHQSSYGREAAGVFAAAVAAACAPGATPDSVVAACLSLAKDGTRSAIESVCDVASRHSDVESALQPLREAVTPFDTVGPDYRSPSLGARRPSRLHAIEELPVALGMLVAARGDYRHAVLGSVNYGRDCDSIATMSGALAGALGSPVPSDWAKQVAEASRLDLHAPATVLAEVAREVFARDVRRRRDHEEAFTSAAALR